MASLKISEFAAAPSINSDAILPMVQLSGPDLVDFKINFDQVATVLATKLTVPAYVKTWNASTNSPALASSVGTVGTLYAIGVAGSTSLNGVSTWEVGDYAYFNGSVWSKIEGTGSVPAFVKTWNASANSPTLVSSVGTTGTLYAVNVAGSTTLNGVSSWAVGDYVYFNGSVWSKIVANDPSITGTHGTNWVGAIPSTTADIQYTKIGRTVTLQFALVSQTATSTSTISADTNLPSFLWPLNTIRQPITAIVNGLSDAGQVDILAGDGSIIFYATAAGVSYTSGQVSGFSTQTVTYISGS